MDLFETAKSVRLRSHHDKYLTAEEDEDDVTQERNGSSRNARWAVEFVGGGSAIRLKSCYNKYLTASNQPFLLGVKGRKVVQSLPRRLDSSVEWEPIRDGTQVRLRTRHGNYLRANGGLPPWRNSVTHDVPYRTATQDWVLWDVDVVEILDRSDHYHQQNKDHNLGQKNPGQGPGGEVHVKQQGSMQVKVGDLGSSGSESSSVSMGSQKFQRQESRDSGTYSTAKAGGRLIYYQVADERGNVGDAVEGNKSFTFKGHNVAELTEKLAAETGLQDIFVCTRSPLNGKLFPLRLQLPPNNTDMHIVVVSSTSKLGRELAKGGIS